jgi:hypothetical protein
MSPDFEPNPRDSIDLFGQEHLVQPHPQVPYMPYSQEAGRAVVYQLVNQRGEFRALKVFRQKYRNHALIDSVQKLRGVENFRGLRAAQRQVVEPSDPAAQKYRNLSYAMLMPWINGKTWFDILHHARTQRYYLHDSFDVRRSSAIRLCDCFLEVMEGLETNKVAHTNISPGNVMIEIDPIDVQLVDIEDIYIPGAPVPFEPRRGLKGYRHLKDSEGELLWRAEGDRYAGAVLAAEMIILANLELGRKATDEGYFTDHRGTSIGVARYREAQAWLNTTAPEFAKVFERSWLAESLQECPTFSELRMPIKKLADSVTRQSTEPGTISPLPPPRRYDTEVQGGRVAWKPWEPLPGRTAQAGTVYVCPRGDYRWSQHSVGERVPSCPYHKVPLVLIDESESEQVKQVVIWDREQDDGTTGQSFRVIMWVLVAVAIMLALVVLIAIASQ